MTAIHVCTRRSIRPLIHAAVPLLIGSGICWLCAAGCSDDTGRPDSGDSPFLPRTSPENLLHNLRAAYQLRDYVELDSLLADDFEFRLSVEDAGQPGMPDAWGHTDEVDIHEQMFDPELVRSLVLDFEIGPRVFDPEEQLWSITLTDVDLYFYGLVPGYPAVRAFTVSDGNERFWFRQNPRTWRWTTRKIWTIVRWQDSPIDEAARAAPAFRSGSGSTWGAIKSRFL